MATLTQPSWDPSPVPELPKVTTVTLVVRPRKTATGVQVRYRLFGGARIRFRPPSAGALIRDDERPDSKPAPDPVERDGLVIIDHYPGMNSETEIVRGIAIEQSGPDKPGVATLSVSVWDLDADGSPQNMSSKDVMTSFL